MFKRTHPSIVTVLSGGLGLSLAACSGKESMSPPTSNPPPVTDGAEGNDAGQGVVPESGEAPGSQEGDRGAPSGRVAGEPLPGNPPAPEPGPLPTWAQVESDHPKGATNPPRPVLVVMADGPRCWKEWVGGMVRPSEDVRQLGGRLITDPAQTEGTEIACPRRQAQSILDKAAAREDAPTEK